jgi:hypothetical protein
MSQLKVNGIRHTGASSDAVTLATDGTCTAKLTNNLSNRNAIINGGMMISQRSTSKTVGSGIGGCQTLDRWQTSIGGTAQYTQSQSTDEPGGFMNSMKYECTTADASPAASDSFRIIYKGEGYDAQRFGKGTSRAVSATLSFWIKTNKTGNYQVNWRDINNSRMVGAQYTVSSANTWERKEITFPTESSNGELYKTNGQGLYLEWWFTSGSNQTSGSVPTSWEAYDATDRAAGLNVNMADATGNTLYITGVQMEASDYATDFEHRSYGDELAKCQRYFYLAASGADDAVATVAICFNYGTGSARAMLYFPTTMRTIPDIFEVSGTDYWRILQAGGTNDYPDSVHGGNERLNMAETAFEDDVSGMTAGQATLLRINNAAARLGYDAEL